ncbi:helix-turn-helix transcriptional regulator [Neoroseomonas rubea]|uniref:helix-turn-helix transcriptional regulator n=1 Tax=Neoroseomonas rubea TaxID=2748666 RepID=UPI0018DF48FE|nr:helix-turn-helix domain-containing protein [Roseomonas rubea]
MDEYLDEVALAKRLKLSRRSIQRFRTTGEGPPFVRVGQRRVAYRLADVEAWAEARTFRHRAAEMAGKSRK